MNGLAAQDGDTNPNGKWKWVNRTLNENKIAILVLQEMHLDQTTVDRIRKDYNQKMEIMFSADSDSPQARAGVAFIINKTLIAPREIITHEILLGRALLIKIKWLESEETNILNIYAPNNKSSHPTFWKRIEDTRMRKRLPRPDFMLGDFNVTEDEIDRAPAKPDNRSATEAMREMRLAWEVQDEWRHTHPNEHTFTFRTTANDQDVKSRLDRIYVKKQIAPLTYDWKIKPSSVPTDHWMVTVKYAPKDATNIGKGRWTWPLYSLKDERLIKLIINRGIELQRDLDDWTLHPTSRDTSTPQHLWKAFKDDIKRLAKKHTQESYHRITTRINNLEEDRKRLAESPDLDSNNMTRWNEAVIANEITHLGNIQA